MMRDNHVEFDVPSPEHQAKSYVVDQERNKITVIQSVKETPTKPNHQSSSNQINEQVQSEE